MVKDFVDLGIYFSLSGYFFRADKAEKRSVFDLVPSDRILLETDAPDMMPPADLVRLALPAVDGRPVNHPANLIAIYEAYAKWKGVEMADVITRVRENFVSWFFRGARAEHLSRYPPLSER
jgi:TatD DNase family protein